MFLLLFYQNHVIKLEVMCMISYYNNFRDQGKVKIFLSNFQTIYQSPYKNLRFFKIFLFFLLIIRFLAINYFKFFYSVF